MSCERFEGEGLLALEQGKALDAHFSECEDCLRARAEYEQLTLTAKVNLGEPPADWQRRVLNYMSHNTPKSPEQPIISSAPTVRLLASAAALVVFIGAMLFLNSSNTVPLEGTLEWNVIATDTIYRGTSARPGDTLQITTSVSNAPFAQIRVVNESGKLVLACSNKLPCQLENGAPTVSLTLRGVGSYRILLLLSNDAIPSASDNMNTDLAELHRVGVHVLSSELIKVR